MAAPRTTGSAAMYRDACARGAEGILAKRAESRYLSGRSTDWLKIKCVQQQEFVIGGYTEPQGARERLGALLVGYYDGDGKLRYAGKVGTGYDRDMLELLFRRLTPLHRRTSPGIAPAATNATRGAASAAPLVVLVFAVERSRYGWFESARPPSANSSPSDATRSFWNSSPPPKSPL